MSSQTADCVSKILLRVLTLSTNPIREDRYLNKKDLEDILEEATRAGINQAQFEAQSVLMNKALGAILGQGNVDFLSIRPDSASSIRLPTVIVEREGLFDSISQLIL